MDFYEKHRAEMLAHCIRLARLDKHYAWWAANRYASDSEGVLHDLPQLLTEAMRAEAAARSAMPPSSTPDMAPMQTTAPNATFD
ncbi:hypothetical protein [uncultured Xylophilus sp.]|uniref:hypothetical protein n=1 Tax=uncultured Xylophilus sp. TaxID=296832 RepID=UPI0025D05FA0|nr:hypothetical protein [uncultured Xylophilus sp.]